MELISQLGGQLFASEGTFILFLRTLDDVVVDEGRGRGDGPSAAPRQTTAVQHRVRHLVPAAAPHRHHRLDGVVGAAPRDNVADGAVRAVLDVERLPRSVAAGVEGAPDHRRVRHTVEGDERGECRV